MTKYQKFTEFIKENHRFTLKDVMQYLMAPDEMHDYMTEILPKIYPTVPIEQKQEVLNYLHKYRNMWKNYNLRSLIQAIRIRVGVSNGIDWKKMVAVLSRGSM